MTGRTQFMGFPNDKPVDKLSAQWLSTTEAWSSWEPEDFAEAQMSSRMIGSM